MVSNIQGDQCQNQCVIHSCTVPIFGCHWIVTLIKEPSNWQYVVQDRLAVKQLQFACEQACTDNLQFSLGQEVLAVHLLL